MTGSTNEPSETPERGLISDDDLPEDLQPEDDESFDEERSADPADPLT